MHETGSAVREAWRPNLQQRAIPPPWSEWESALFLDSTGLEGHGLSELRRSELLGTSAPDASRGSVDCVEWRGGL